VLFVGQIKDERRGKRGKGEKRRTRKEGEE
jgi:hypothetical protein